MYFSKQWVPHERNLRLKLGFFLSNVVKLTTFWVFIILKSNTILIANGSRFRENTTHG